MTNYEIIYDPIVTEFEDHSSADSVISDEIVERENSFSHSNSFTSYSRMDMTCFQSQLSEKDSEYILFEENECSSSVGNGNLEVEKTKKQNDENVPPCDTGPPSVNNQMEHNSVLDDTLEVGAKNPIESEFSQKHISYKLMSTYSSEFIREQSNLFISCSTRSKGTHTKTKNSNVHKIWQLESSNKLNNANEIQQPVYLLGNMEVLDHNFEPENNVNSSILACRSLSTVDDEPEDSTVVHVFDRITRGTDNQKIPKSILKGRL